MNLRQIEILRDDPPPHHGCAADELGVAAGYQQRAESDGSAGRLCPVRTGQQPVVPDGGALTLYKESEAIFALHAKLENRVRDFRESRAGRLSIMATPPLAYSVVSPTLSGFLGRRPQTRVFFDVRRYEGIIDGVLNGVAELGFALGLSQHPGIAHEILHSGEMVCVLPPSHPLVDRPVISASDLVGLPFIGLERGTRMEKPGENFAQAGSPFQPSVEVRYCNTACVLAAPASAPRSSIRYRPARPAATTLWSGASLPRSHPRLHAVVGSRTSVAHRQGICR